MSPVGSMAEDYCGQNCFRKNGDNQGEKDSQKMSCTNQHRSCKTKVWYSRIFNKKYSSKKATRLIRVKEKINSL